MNGIRLEVLWASDFDEKSTRGVQPILKAQMQVSSQEGCSYTWRSSDQMCL